MSTTTKVLIGVAVLAGVYLLSRSSAAAAVPSSLAAPSAPPTTVLPGVGSIGLRVGSFIGGSFFQGPAPIHGLIPAVMPI